MIVNIHNRNIFTVSCFTVYKNIQKKKKNHLGDVTKLVLSVYMFKIYQHRH